MSSGGKVIVIAEIGENHLGDIGLAKRMIKEAASAGADYVKFQSYKPENFSKDDPEYGWFKRVHISDEAHFSLKEYAQMCRVKFLSSPFSLERARFLCEGLGLKEIKIASGMMLNLSLLDYVNEHADTVFLSTGMANITEIKKSLSHLNKVRKCYILHCVTQYPCKDMEANVSAVRTLQKEFPEYEIGYSDHTIGELACLIAVALGARVIEKHFTFDKACKDGTDHILSVTPSELKSLISNITITQQLLGDENKVPRRSEEEIKEFVRNRFI
ncbi:MAG: N-acetylneuraminate synthase family protein [Candidatus Omnitrophica bacterium]|nr:N-acetylneuraminate synthase family protein [Candidatus Omnitrophota bacterium]MDD5591894.1 N-acetylneuraminate synthase family protein [Candidatus Omnitrophota bacterium]